jgi:hypothetical protein
MNKEVLAIGIALGVLIALLIVATNAPVIPERRAQPSKDGSGATTFTIHMPLNGKCPSGYKRQERVFTERDGSEHPACVKPHPPGENSTDYLNPGESEHMYIEVPEPERRKG